MALTVCERWVSKYALLEPEDIVASSGSRQFRCHLPEGWVICTWVMKKERLSYSSGFLFPAQTGMRKLSARDATALLDQALSSRSARG